MGDFNTAFTALSLVLGVFSSFYNQDLNCGSNFTTSGSTWVLHIAVLPLIMSFLCLIIYAIQEFTHGN